MCRWTYPRHLPEVSDMYGGLPIGIIVIVIVEVTQVKKILAAT